jgi:hypothetical protein
VQGLGVPPLVTLVSTLIYVAFVGWMIIQLSGHGGWSPMHQFALACGAYGLYIIGSPVAPAWVFLMTWHADHIAVQAVFGGAATAYLYWLGRRIQRYQAAYPWPVFGVPTLDDPIRPTHEARHTSE